MSQEILPTIDASTEIKFRVKALGLHLLASGAVLCVLLGGFYAGWYRWPGWYLADVTRVTAVLAGVDLVVGPLLTFVIASGDKPRRVLARDMAVIATVQLCALCYGAASLWNGRPLYYAFSEDVLQLVQAYDIDPAELALARGRHAPLLPHWYSLPRWIWAPLPEDDAERDRIIAQAVGGGSDVIGMPRYYRRWESGLSVLRTRLKRVDDLQYFSASEKKTLAARMRAAGFVPDHPNSLAFLGRGRPLLAVFDPATATIAALIGTK